jgi:flagellar basal-body rod protein FlgC
MSLTGVFDIAGMGMSAQSIRLNTTASNLANANSAGSSPDDVYRARHPVFESVRMEQMANSFDVMADEGSTGIRVSRIVESNAAPNKRYEPDHEKADEQGFVLYPNVNVVEEMADMISASRSFQINVEVMNSAKAMIQRVLTLGQ